MNRQINVVTADVLVVGGGFAGIWAALRAQELGAQVVLVEKGKVGYSGCSTLASGVQACVEEGDDLELWKQQIVERSDYFADQDWVDRFLTHQTVRAKINVAKLGLDPDKDVEFTSLGEPAARLAALESGLVDASQLNPPFNKMAVAKGFNILARGMDYLDLPTSGIGVNDAKIANDREEAKKVIKATLQALKFIRNNREATINSLMQWANLERKDAEETYDDGVPSLSLDGKISPTAIENVLMALEIDRSKTEPENLIDQSLLLEVLQQWPDLAQ